PLLLQGMGAGMLMTPVILFIISSVPESYSQSASAVGVFVRYTFFAISTGLINYFSLYYARIHAMRITDHLSRADTGMQERLHLYQSALQGRGLMPDHAAKAATGLLDKVVQKQAFLKYAMDYYQMAGMVILVLMLLIVMAPFINRIRINVKSKQPAAATF
ncbi:MAG TPA: hypothetical protein VM802_17305, partial [Chitinophaga sp.]|nr:hypothetical protein [Chitinophaga sp.]